MELRKKTNEIWNEIYEKEIEFLPSALQLNKANNFEANFLEILKRIKIKSHAIIGDETCYSLPTGGIIKRDNKKGMIYFTSEVNPEIRKEIERGFYTEK